MDERELRTAAGPCAPPQACSCGSGCETDFGRRASRVYSGGNLEEAFVGRCDRRHGEPLEKNQDSRASKVTVKKGALLFVEGSAPGRHYVVWCRGKKLLEDEDGRDR